MSRTLLLLAILAGASGAAARAQQRPLPDTAEMERELKRFLDVYSILESQGADPVSFDEVIYGGAIPGMLRRLDPHTVFFNPDQFRQLQEMEQSLTKGFGTIVSLLPGRVIVLQTQPGSPSQKSGLSPGDEIVAINDIALSRLEVEQLVQLLGAARQHPASILVRRPGTAKLLPLTLTPAELQAPSVDRAFLLLPGSAFVRVSSFDTATGKELGDAIEKLGGASLKSLVLDLRDNPGGVLAAGLETAALFLPSGSRVLSARGRSSETRDVTVPEGRTPYTFPVAVLVNAKTASAAEIVAGALQDHDRAPVLGEPTFGKGLVQSVYPLSQNTGLALTTAFYYTPSGRSIQRPLRGVELESATSTIGRPEYKTDRGRTVRGGGGIEPDIAVSRPAPTPFHAAMELSASFTAFASEWLLKNRSLVKPDFEVDAATLDEFQLWLSRRNIRPALREWTAEREFVTSRLKQEIITQVLGVAAGDEIEFRRDPVVRRALEAIAGSK